MGIQRVARILAAAAAVFILTQTRMEAQATPAAPQVRMRWQDFISGPDGAARLASLEKAVQKMKSLNSSPQDSADYRRSWQYWANIHGYYGPTSPNGTVEKHLALLKLYGMSEYLPYYDGITDQTAPDSIATTVWATCQHSTQKTQALNFFGWHRMYLYYYERVLRWASGDDTLRLPYWDYTDPAQLTLPADFRSTSASLYDARRDPGMNAGTSTLDSNSTDINDLLAITDYFDYESQIEEGVHGYVHCTVGPNCPVAHMGDVPVAGNDPIFYSHHANIDRMWACWQQLYGTPDGTWQDQEFSFVDETGTLQTQPVKKFLDSTVLGYVYDNVSDCKRPEAAATVASMTFAAPEETPAPAAASGGERKAAMVGAVKTIAIKGPTTSVDLDLPRPKLEGALKDLAQPGTVQLILRDITADSHPGTLFNVYLAKKDDPANRQHVGTISWFGAFSHHHEGDSGPETKTRTFDVTDELRALGDSSLAAAGLTVVIEATDGRVPADPAKLQAHRDKASKAFRAESNLRIGSIELHAVPAPPKPEKK